MLPILHPHLVPLLHLHLPLLFQLDLLPSHLDLLPLISLPDLDLLPSHLDLLPLISLPDLDLLHTKLFQDVLLLSHASLLVSPPDGSFS
jgi:hypothetical protein